MSPIARRRFLAGLLAGGVAPALPARVSERRCFVGCRVVGDGQHLASVFDRSGHVRHNFPLPGRGHGFAVQPRSGRVVVFARRPGDWALVLEPATGAILGRLAANAGRHFYGHGAFSPDGARLYTSENRYEDGTGVIGVWEATGRWRRIREWSSHGVGPHEIHVLARGTMLAVANGGIRTHPDLDTRGSPCSPGRRTAWPPRPAPAESRGGSGARTGRAKLNLDTMSSSLAVLDIATGRLVRSASFGVRHRRLSIRHLDVHRDARIVVAMQHEGSRRDRVPLIAFERDGRLLPAYAPDDISPTMRQYAGSVSFDSSGDYAAVSHPREGIASVWAVRAARLLQVAELADTCGIARGAARGTFIVTGAGGRVALIDALAGESTVLSSSDGAHWDNHLLALGTGM